MNEPRRALEVRLQDHVKAVVDGAADRLKQQNLTEIGVHAREGNRALANGERAGRIETAGQAVVGVVTNSSSCCDGAVNCGASRPARPSKLTVCCRNCRLRNSSIQNAGIAFAVFVDTE